MFPSGSVTKGKNYSYNKIIDLYTRTQMSKPYVEGQNRNPGYPYTEYTAHDAQERNSCR